eukprot:10211440-Heterocapsa_arctica.AAC.1
MSEDTSQVAACRAREAFAAWYDNFYQYIDDRTTGWWGHYAMKCILDVPCNSSLPVLGDTGVLFPDAVLSRWPIHCPAYAP